MEAKLAQVGEVVVVTINGRLDIDKTHPFKEACFKNLLDKKVVFNLQQLNFVGSTGIQNFFQAIQEINSKNKYGLRIAGMTPDFLRLWSVRSSQDLAIYESTNIAVQSFSESFVPPTVTVAALEIPEAEAVETQGDQDPSERIS